jgi:hypothetical protein
MRIVGLMHVGSANGDRADLQQGMVVTHVRDRDLAQFDGERLEGVLNDGGLCGHVRIVVPVWCALHEYQITPNLAHYGRGNTALSSCGERFRDDRSIS